jgi:3-hydroxyisobutyrate dehydrogenase-like beta-hydroxyacid dehydrogenase
MHVAILGVGKMGAAMAKELVAAGHQVHLWNRNKPIADDLVNSLSSGTSSSYNSVPDALVQADIAICTFTNGEVTQSVLLEKPETLSDVKSNLIIVDMGTSGVESAKILQSELSKRRIAFIDAPVSGSVATVAAHQLLVMASGKPSDIERAKPVFSAFAKQTAYLGQAGAGQAMKLAVNLIVHTLSAAVSESLALAIANGIDPAAAYDVLEESVVAAPFVKYKRSAFLDSSTPVAMRIDTVNKDMNLILALGKSSGVELSSTAGVAELYSRAATNGFDSQDMAGLLRFIRG